MPNRALTTLRRQQHLTVAGAVLLAAAIATAQTNTLLPSPSRTAFKCVVAGGVSYSDAPCPDAQRLELQPTRGVDKTSGKAMTGADVRAERANEQFAEAVKPITGMTSAQLDVQRRRVNLPGAAKAECGRPDRELPDAERAAATVPRGTQADQANRQLLVARQRFRALGC